MTGKLLKMLKENFRCGRMYDTARTEFLTGRFAAPCRRRCCDGS